MGIAFNGQKLAGAAFNGAKVAGIAHNGQVIWTSSQAVAMGMDLATYQTPPSQSPPDWTTLTDWVASAGFPETVITSGALMLPAGTYDLDLYLHLNNPVASTYRVRLIDSDDNQLVYSESGSHISIITSGLVVPAGGIRFQVSNSAGTTSRRGITTNTYCRLVPSS
ncbi:hypothetical protein [Hoyosella altamirensis]|uniref:Uncharacterized protein n=1 Tax=Hoyosella altamirensis TaxID=616997 RepID=A0A839RMU0_9ACTN|nr:hypothetical protein [Hoyosella altamirensis]MBB3037333.1 hypothetical protein [Hoyosella altamirensis]MBB3038420.1 hypothetical protein [Hoyosella altamirensis]